jgi:lipopolysaccharide/colanic/teichoic acid biosynthesis glycosyltransferase
MTSMDSHGATNELLREGSDNEPGTEDPSPAGPSENPKQNQAPLKIGSPLVPQLKNLFDVVASSQAERFTPIPAHQNARLVKRFELAILIFCSLAPAIGLWAALDRTLFAGAFLETLAALMVAIAGAWYALRQLKGHANARDVSYVLPVNFVAFTSVVTILALVRIPYSASLLATGAICAIACSFGLALYGRRLVQPHVIVGGGRSAEIPIGGQYVPAPNAEKLENLIDSGWRDWAIVADLHYPHSQNHERLFAKAALHGIPVYHYRSVAEGLSGQVKINHLSENEFGSLIPNAPYMSLKRVVDVLGALILLPLLSPVFAVLAMLIRLDSPGKALFIQERVGYRGEKFRMIKFRTMRERVVAADQKEQRNDAMTKSDDDRITGIGHFLRKTRMDELPQMINVLIGDMSFIGPRPEACSLSEWYQSELPFYSYRHIVRPGITGWAQVTQGHVTDVSDVLSKLRYDFYYIKNISLWLDVLIVLKTFRVIVTGSGAK